MFKKILIANRGEIAVRILRTCQKMNIKTALVYSESDRKTFAVKLADEAFYIGASAPSESYLNHQKIIEIAKQSNIDAIHPGFGFLSENALFAEQVRKSNMAFIGPSPKVIRNMGDKILARNLAKKAGLTIIPGIDINSSNLADIQTILKTVRFPIMIKASAGGGGKGLRVVRNKQELEEGIMLAKSEAKHAFGDDRIFIEQFIETPRHIEIQILADQKGNVLHLGERECSIQRRHQKIIEEAPSPVFKNSEIRNQMADQAIKLAKAMHYDSVGTVEFILDQDLNFYFLEMNTRLQVEHAITEMITGFDLVEEMIKIAYGNPVSYQQKDISFKGHAIEARIYAEDPIRQFAPSIGKLTHYKEPELNSALKITDNAKINSPNTKLTPDQKEKITEQIRIDSGVEEGDQISVYYDPMIAKVIAHGKNRNIAIENLIWTLNKYQIDGITTNISFLQAILNSTAFKTGNTNTHFIQTHFPNGFENRCANEEELKWSSAIIAFIADFDYSRFFHQDTLKQRAECFMDWTILSNQGKTEISVNRKNLKNANIRVKGDDNLYSLITDYKPGQNFINFYFNQKQHMVFVKKQGMEYKLSSKDLVFKAKCLLTEDADLLALLPEIKIEKNKKQILSPLSGLVLKLYVKEKQTVKQGENMFAVEAMKMENIIKAEEGGKIKSIHIKEGDQVLADEILIEFFD